MVGLYASLVGAVVVILLVVIGIWLTWVSLRSEKHRPAALQPAEPDESE